MSDGVKIFLGTSMVFHVGYRTATSHDVGVTVASVVIAWGLITLVLVAFVGWSPKK